MTDIIGAALLAYLDGRDDARISVNSTLTEDEDLNAAYFFREYEEMPEWEQLALDLCRGNVLDIGAGAGCHALWLQEQGLAVTALDLSPGAVEVMQRIGVQDVQLADALSWEGGLYDTVLMLMNGIGITGTLEGLDQFFAHLPHLLKEDGELLLESTDIIYMYKDEEGKLREDLDQGGYYGEIQYQMVFDGIEGEWFDWLYIDFDLLREKAQAHGLFCEKLYETDQHNYLARILR